MSTTFFGTAWRGLAPVGSALVLAACGGDDVEVRVAEGAAAPVGTTPPAPAPVPTPAPVIVTPPQAQSATAGGSATFSVAATGEALNYQWLRGDTPIAEATGASYTTPSTALADNGATFTVRVCSGPPANGNCVNSTAVALTVTAPIGIGPPGGTVDGPNGTRVVVPAGALTTYVDIAIAAAGTAGVPSFPPSGVSAIGNAYAFTPHGTAFAQPATVRVPFDPAALPAGATPRLYRAEPGGSYAEVAGATVSGNFLEAQVGRFSFFGPGAVPPPPSALRFSEISASCARESLSGNVYCWGRQGDIAYLSGLADAPQGSNFPEPTRLPPKSLTNIVGGFGYVCGINADEVWSIGDDQVTAPSGVAGPQARRQWAKIQLPTGVVLHKLAGGGRFVCGIGAPNSPDANARGRVYCWGSDLRGQLGRGAYVFQGVTVEPVVGDNLYVALAAGGAHVCAARQLDGEVFCWGDNSQGQLVAGELGTADASNAPLARGLTVDPRQGALLPVCGLKPDGTAFCWGDNFYGQMGNGTAGTGNFGQNYRAPSEVPGIKFKSLSTGETMCGIALDNQVYCWGFASRGSLGNGQETAGTGSNASKQTTPTLVSVPSGVTFAAIANTSGGKCARSTDNRVYCWGDNRSYQSGTGSNTPSSVTVPTPIKDTGLTRAMP
ncbi:MAG: hypothetical protein ACK6C0_06305 [Betaproteobacteria bacterium]